MHFKIQQIIYRRTFEGDHYWFYFEDILCVCDLTTYCPKSTLNNNKVRKLLILL